MTKFDGGVLVVDGGESLTLDEDSHADSFFVGGTSTGTLIIEAGAKVLMDVNDGQFHIGGSASGQGFVTVRGETLEVETTLDISRTGNPGATPFLAVGAFGTGELSIEDHALLRTQSASIGLHAGSSGTVTLDLAGWVAFHIAVGDSGQGTLNVHNNASLASQDTVIGNSSTGDGEATIDHAFWTVDGTFAVGRDGGTGSLDIINGATLTFLRPGSWDFTIGFTDGAGSVLVSGAGSELSVNREGNFIHVGSSGFGTLNVTNQGLVRTPLLLMGDDGSASASGGGTILVGDRIDLGFGTLHVMDGGRIVVGQASAISGAVHVGAAGRLDGDGVLDGNLVNDGLVDGTFFFQGDAANTVVNNGVMSGVIRLGGGNDSFKGNGDTRAKVFGEDGKDTLTGSADADRLYGDDGNDILTGRGGRDTLTGGPDRDRFDFNSIKDSVTGSRRDKIMDLKRGDDDIDLRTIDAQKGGGHQKFKWIGKQDFSDTKGELRYEDKGSTVIVQGDVNGDGKADFEIFVAVSSLGKGDFLL